jgi:uncharacterized protein YbjQ (UPF0145 family)
LIVTTTPEVQGRPVQEYFGVVTGEAILGANVFRDVFAGIRDIIGGRSGSYERVLREARDMAIAEMQEEAPDAAPTPSSGWTSTTRRSATPGSMLMVSASGTAVRLSPRGRGGRALTVVVADRLSVVRHSRGALARPRERRSTPGRPADRRESRGAGRAPSPWSRVAGRTTGRRRGRCWSGSGRTPAAPSASASRACPGQASRPPSRRSAAC